MSAQVTSIATEPPCLNCNFRVDLGGSKSTEEVGFCEVIFPTFTINSHTELKRDLASTHDASQLLLRRGVTGALDLYQWWDKARRGRAPKQRMVKVQLMSADHAAIVMTWLFRNARPVSLSYSPLNALQGEVQMETLALAFDSVELRRK
jgi:phage tail-like protein